MGNLFRTGGGGKKINPTVDVTNRKYGCGSENGGNQLKISATKDMKKALLVGAVTQTNVENYGSYYNFVNASITSNRTLTSIPGIPYDTIHFNHPYPGSYKNTVNSACLIYLVNDVKKGDYFTITQSAEGGADYYKSLTLIELD